MHFIVRAKDLGFNLADIQQLTSLWRDQQRPSSEVKQLAQAHIKALESRAALLLDMAAKLRVLAEQCQGTSILIAPSWMVWKAAIAPGR